MKWIPTLSGKLVWAVQIAHAAEFSLSDLVFSRVPKTKERIAYVEHTEKMAEKYGVSAEELARTIIEESQYTHFVNGKILRGKDGEWGICQCMWNTFAGFEEEFGREDLTVKDPYDSIEMMALAFEAGYQEQWMGWLKVYKPELYKKYMNKWLKKNGK